MTAAVTQKHVKTVKRQQIRASDTDVTESTQVVQTHVLLVRCKCTETFPALSPADLLRRRSQMTSMKRNTKIYFSSVSCELVYFPMEDSNTLSTSAVKFEYKLFSIDLCPERVYLCSQAGAYASEAPSETCWQQPCSHNSHGNICGFP